MGGNNATVAKAIECPEREPAEKFGGKLQGDAAGIAIDAAQRRGVTAYLFVRMVGASKIVATDCQNAQIALGNDARGTRVAVDQAEFTERLPGLQPGELNDRAVRL